MFVKRGCIFVAGANTQRGDAMNAKRPARVSVTLELDAALMDQMANALRYLPPGWDQARLFEVGVTELLEQLERKYNQGKPFPAQPASSPSA
jgi:hypothetical protein